MQFSIIVPIYNVEKYLSACIDSILAQTYGDYEIILVDDGSTDTSPQICDQYANQHACIHVIHKPNGGLSDARNVGLKVARGEYIFFIDSDDYLIDNAVLSRIVDKLKGKPDVVAFKAVKWFESTGKMGVNTDDLSVSSDSLEPYEKYLELIDKDTYSNSAWSKVIKHSILKENHIEFEKGLLGEDNDWYYKVVSHLTSLELINEPLYVYRQRAGSITKTYTKKNMEHLLWIIEKWTKYVNEGELTGNKEVIRNSLAKQYCHAIIGYCSLSHAKEFLPRLKRQNYLLQYSNNPRVKAFRRLNRLVGLSGTIWLLKFRKLFIK
ncbi:MAG: glycosyltransferase [Bacteroidaceae bacterium]|nr:glycosyltransferase [Bacteroidaceae bacterium]